MAVFKYAAVTGEGQQVKSTIEGVSLSAAENDLLRQNLTVKWIREKKGFAQIEISPERVPRQEILQEVIPALGLARQCLAQTAKPGSRGGAGGTRIF